MSTATLIRMPDNPHDGFSQLYADPVTVNLLWSDVRPPALVQPRDDVPGVASVPGRYIGAIVVRAIAVAWVVYGSICVRLV
jgi:hypothetical protein